jgi:hypothetical protein
MIALIPRSAASMHVQSLIVEDVDPIRDELSEDNWPWWERIIITVNEDGPDNLKAFVDAVESENARASAGRRTMLTITGDVMLGRTPHRIMVEQNDWTAPYPLVADEHQKGDLIIGNLECAITDSFEPPADPRTFSFMTFTDALEALQLAGYHALSGANNHSLDFGVVGMRDTTAAHGMTFAILRYFNVAGCDPAGRTGQSTPGATHLIKVACEAAVGKRDFIEVYGTDYPTPDGSCVRDFIHVKDLVTAHRLALEDLRRGSDSMLVNCGYGRGYSVLEVLDSVRRVSGRSIDVRLGPRRKGDLASVIAGTQRIRERLGWVPALDDLDAIISTSLEWEEQLARMKGETTRPARAYALS